MAARCQDATHFTWAITKSWIRNFFAGNSVHQGNIFIFTLHFKLCRVNAHVVSHLWCDGAVCSLNWLMDCIKQKDLGAKTLLWWGFLTLCRLCQSGLKDFNESAAAAAAEYVIAGSGSGWWASRMGLIQRHWKKKRNVEAKSSLSSLFILNLHAYIQHVFPLLSPFLELKLSVLGCFSNSLEVWSFY